MQENHVLVCHGRVPIEELGLEAPEGVKVKEAKSAVGDSALGDRVVDIKMRQKGRSVTITLAEPITLEAVAGLAVALEW